MKYLSLYKTQSEHDSDNSRLTPNISLITDEKKMILTNENNIGTIFEGVDILESFDDIINRFPTGNSTCMPGLKIYGDNSDQSKAKNIKLYNDAQKWRDNFISYHGSSDTGQGINMKIDALVIYDTIWDEYDEYYYYNIDIYNDRIILLYGYDSEVLTISSDGSVIFNEFPTNDSTHMPVINIYTDNTSQSKANNIELYNNAQEWRSNYISDNGLNDTGQDVYMLIDSLIIDEVNIDKYDQIFRYEIIIYNDHIILIDRDNNQEILTISSDGSVSNINLPTTPLPQVPDIDTTSTFLPIFNIFPTPTYAATIMPRLKIYTDNTNQSKAENIKLYNNARIWRSNYILNNGLSDTGQGIKMKVDALVIDGLAEDSYDDNYRYNIDIYNHCIILYGWDGVQVLTINSDGSVIFNEFPTDNSTHMPVINIYTDNTSQSKTNNIELYNNAQEWRSNYISNNGLSDTGQVIFMYVDALIIDEVNIDKYDRNYYYYIDIYKDHIILIDTNNHQEILTISGDGSIQNLYNKFPSDTSSRMPGLKIYTDNTDQSKSNNIELYNDARQWRKDFILYRGLNDTGQAIYMDVNALIIDNKIIDKYDQNYYYYIDIYNDHIILYGYGSEVLTISGDGSVRQINPIPN